MTELPESIISIIRKNSGLILSEIHKPAVLEFINGRLLELSMNIESYCAHLESNSQEMMNLINKTTINETYFFREEAQFEFLKNIFFPSQSYTAAKIWCAACSTGEEPLSILALAKSMGIEVDLYASDINSNALSFFRKGIYKKRSFRKDGEKFHQVLQFIGKKNENEFEVNSECLSRIKIQEINLSNISVLPFESGFFDVVILRNILYYFSTELSMKILEKVWNILKPNGIVILSMNEIACINCDELYEKKKAHSVYYLKKRPSKIQSYAATKTKKIKVPDAPEKNEKTPVFARDKGAMNETEKTVENHAKAKAESKNSVADNSGELEMAKTSREIYRLLDSKMFDKAEALIREISIAPKELEYRYFFNGLLNFYRGTYQQAEEFNFKAICLNRDFWPAYIALGLTYKRQGKTGKMTDTFNKALNILDEYLKSGKICYNFIVEFDPAYFIDLCKNQIRQAENGGE